MNNNMDDMKKDEIKRINACYRIYGADLETDQYINEYGELDNKVVQWCVMDIDKQVEKGRDLKKMVNYFTELMKTDGTLIVYFHNLNFDGEHIIRSGYLHEMEKNGYKIEPFQRRGNLYWITITDQENNILVIRDSLKKFQGTLEDMAETFNLPPKLKNEGGEGSKEFEMGWSDKFDFDDPNNWKYIERDCEIVMLGMKQLHSNGQNKPTATGDVFPLFRKSISGKKSAFDNAKWDTLFPGDIPNSIQDNFKEAYMGGINYSNPNRRGAVSESEDARKYGVSFYDRNSMYPSVMCSIDGIERFPYGKPKIQYEPPNNPAIFYIVRFSGKLTLKDGHIPWLRFRRSDDYRMEGLSDFSSPIYQCNCFHPFTFSMVDMYWVNEHYDIEYENDGIEYFYFNSKNGKELGFKKYMEETYKAKEQMKKDGTAYTNPVKYDFLKRKLNSCYGRLGLSRETEKCWLDYNEDGVPIVKSKIVIEESNDSYLPAAIAICSWARNSLLSQAKEIAEHSPLGYDAICHMDTDSIIYIGSGDYIHDNIKDCDQSKETTMGYWSDELKGRTVGSMDSDTDLSYEESGCKRYIFYPHNPTSLKGFKVSMCGVNQKTEKIEKDGKTIEIPIGMWVEILDNPHVLSIDNYEIGKTHYKIKSEWLRKLYESAGKNPDDVNTMKKASKKVRHGVVIYESPMMLGSMERMRIRFGRNG